MSTKSLEPIRADLLYPLPEFQRASGLGRAALASAIRQGLTARKIGNRKYVHGEDFIAYVKTHGKTDDR